MGASTGPEFVCVGSIPRHEAESTLDDTCDAFIGKVVYIRPIYGYGWRHEGHGHFSGYPGVPTPFHARIQRFFGYRMNRRRGFFANVEEVGHPFDGFYMVGCTRHRGCFNFTDRPSAYNMLLSIEEPRIGDESDPNSTAHWPAWFPGGNTHSAGFGDIAETPEHLDDWIQRLQNAV
jgi:hypothetical protein